MSVSDTKLDSHNSIEFMLGTDGSYTKVVKMDNYKLIKKLSMTGKARVTLYLSPSKTEQIYLQTVTQVTELVQKRKKGGKVSVDLGFLGAGIGGEFGCPY